MNTSAEVLLKGLDPAQREAVLAADGPVLVVAGPGTGKTHTRCARLVYLIQVHGVPPERLLAVTFTTRAAREMGERLGKQLGKQARPLLGTFHALCLRWLRTEGHRLGLPKASASVIRTTRSPSCRNVGAPRAWQTIVHGSRPLFRSSCACGTRVWTRSRHSSSSVCSNSTVPMRRAGADTGSSTMRTCWR